MIVTTAVSYFKRYKMEVDLAALAPPPDLADFHFAPWSEAVAGAHAEVLYDSFHQEIDSVIFPSLSSPHGCLTLMNVVSRRMNFVPAATWLAVGPAGPCGAIQGMQEPRRRGRPSERRRRPVLARPGLR